MAVPNHELNELRRFRKTGATDRLAMFEAEIDGLSALRATRMVRVPEVFGCGQAANGQAWIELEYLELESLNAATGARLGEQLAELHRRTGEEVDTTYGWPRDNFIGSTAQSNQPHRTWAGFFSAERLQPQLGMAFRNGMPRALRDQGDRIIESLGAFFLDYRPLPSLLHGDLWSGNVGQLPDGRPVVFDPAVYRGDREADLAMAELFGGFPESFYAAYRATWPLDPGFATRKTLYNLYHILNHYNMFGTGYFNQARRMIERLAAELRS
jgi:fructosamine-3-kinase